LALAPLPVLSSSLVSNNLIHASGWGCFLFRAWMASLMLAFLAPNQGLIKAVLVLFIFFCTTSNSLLTIASLCLALVILRFYADQTSFEEKP
jgi:hypothetical protein